MGEQRAGGRDFQDRIPERPGLEPFLGALRFDAQGLVTVVAQDAHSGEVLMVAHANREAVERTLSTGWVHYFSRSRGRLWKKGEESGHLQRLVELRVDCDGDALLARVEQTGVACHLGYASCFSYRVEADGAVRVVGRRP